MEISARVGCIGLGIMGKPMAQNLLKAGYQLIVHNRSQASVLELVDLGARGASSPAEVARHCDFIITMLPNSADVEQVALGESGLMNGICAGQLFVDMSTISPLVSKKIGTSLEKKGVRSLDAPVSGGEQGAVNGTLSIMVGGLPSDFQRALPLFEVMGQTITHMGPLGSGGYTKLVNQIIVAINITAISEAFVFGARAGVNPRKMVNAISAGLAGSNCLDQKADKILKGDFDPGFKIDLHAKDLKLIQDAAKALDVPIPTTEMVSNFFAALQEKELGGQDHSALIMFFEALAGVQVREQA